MKVWLASLIFVVWIHSLNFCPCVPLILWILLSCVLPFWTPHVLCSQPKLSFVISVCGNLKRNQWWRMTSFHLHLTRSILTSHVILPLLISPVKTNLRMFLLQIVHRTHQMSICHYIAEMTHLPLKIIPICHLSFLKTQRVNILTSYLPLCTIHQIMRMLTNIPNFLIVTVMIYVCLHSVTMLIHSLLICLGH